MGGFFLSVELHRKGSAPRACAAGLFTKTIFNLEIENEKNRHQKWKIYVAHNYILSFAYLNNPPCESILLVGLKGKPFELKSMTISLMQKKPLNILYSL